MRKALIIIVSIILVLVLVMQIGFFVLAYKVNDACKNSTSFKSNYELSVQLQGTFRRCLPKYIKWKLGE